MMRTFPVLAAIAILSIAGSAWAHHPFDAEFDATAPVRLSGTITKVDWSDPHVVVQIGVADPGGQTRTWNFEAASPSMMQNKGWQKDMLKEGQQITVQGYRAKSEPFVAAARVIVLPGGKSMSAADEDDGGPKN
jgi:hypothetical protein